VYHRST
ncbi:hypothetical protein quinque_000005, partial [Culex quinquefasciatus]